MPPFEISGDKNQFRHIFTEDLYVIEEGKSNSVVQEPVEKLSPSQQALPVKDLAIIVLAEKEKSQYGDFLSKIMQAINISPAQADIFSRDEVDRALKSPYKTYISFGEGLRKTGTGIALKMNQVLTEGNSRFLLTDPLPSLEADREKKKTLWEAMQKGLLNP